MESSERKSVCIIGGGIAGLASAVFLDAYGYKITLIERKPVLGGRTFSFKDKITGFEIDNGQHLLMGAYHETLRLLDMIGSRSQILIPAKNRVPLINQMGEMDYFHIPQLPQPFNVLIAFLRLNCFSWKDKLNLFKIKKALKNHNPQKFLKSTVKQWLILMDQSEDAIINFWTPLTLATLNESVDVASAHHLLTVLQKGLLGGAFDSQFLIPKKSLNALIGNPAQTYLEMRGHKIIKSTSALHLHVLDNIVRELECSNGEKIKTDYFVSALPPRGLLKIIPKGFVDSLTYFSGIKKLKFSPIISVNLWFDQNFIPELFVGASSTKTHWFFNKNRISDIQGPPYHYVGVLSAAYDLLETPGHVIKEMVLNDLYKLFPEGKKAKLLHSLVGKEREATICHSTETETYRPFQQSPFENFFVTGDWTQTYLPATIESAALSAKIACGHIVSSFS
ncbi:MAG: phytoene/squalene synthetase fused to flavin containing amine oxidoreductase [uncultured bacterium]|nr:MAG: phytoene/squalene synthetase fused to flavin containing amine oxidoreductase [uncultured bacterium]